MTLIVEIGNVLLHSLHVLAVGSDHQSSEIVTCFISTVASSYVEERAIALGEIHKIGRKKPKARLLSFFIVI